MISVPFDNSGGIPNRLTLITNLSNNATQYLESYQPLTSNISAWNEIFCTKREAIIDFCNTINNIGNYQYFLFFAVLMAVMIIYYFIAKDMELNPYCKTLNWIIEFILPLTSVAFLMYTYFKIT